MKIIHMLQIWARLPPSGTYLLERNERSVRKDYEGQGGRRLRHSVLGFKGCEHVSDDPLVQSSVPEPPEAGERVVVVDAMLHVLA